MRAEEHSLWPGMYEKREEVKKGFETHDDCETYTEPTKGYGHPSTKPTQLGLSVFVVTFVSLSDSDC
ncbi:hypothetical protein Bca52824_019036 [Brassica carinata]|uniref:Uncharacterized protein n=1 Tax=Brassica carinata TaxID=52824 RepID=A0A8X7VQL2_BRACI|nr:hypothetical protein Bca52824_019036 [Brassica carinata]